jgi:hypothetical protein
MTKMKGTKGYTTMYKILHRKQKIDTNPTKKPRVNWCQLQFIYKSDVDTIVSSVATQSTTTHVSNVDTIVSSAATQSPPPHTSVMLTQ